MNAPAMRIAFNGVREAAEASGLRPHHIRQALASYCFGLALQYLLVRHAARNCRIDTVTNAIALRLQKP